MIAFKKYLLSQSDGGLAHLKAALFSGGHLAYELMEEIHGEDYRIDEDSLKHVIKVLGEEAEDV